MTARRLAPPSRLRGEGSPPDETEDVPAPDAAPAPAPAEATPTPVETRTRGTHFDAAAQHVIATGKATLGSLVDIFPRLPHSDLKQILL